MLSRATYLVSVGNNINSRAMTSKADKLPMDTEPVACDNNRVFTLKFGDQTFVPPYSTDNRRINEINVDETQCINNQDEIANFLNSQFTNIGPRLASKLPSTTKAFNLFITPALSVFQLTCINPSDVSNLLINLPVSIAFQTNYSRS